MESVMDKDELVCANTLNFKLECSKLMKYNPRQSANNQILRRTVVRREVQKHCKYCFRSWSDGFFTFKVRPKPLMGKRIRKLLRKQVEAPTKLTLFQQKLLKYVHSNQGNKLVLTCLNCRKREAQPMAKCKYDNYEEEQITPTFKKKKKKKDLFVGLNPEVVLKTVLNKNASIESPNNFETSKKIINYSKTFNLSSLNDQKNLKFQAAKPKSDIQLINEACSFNPNDVKNNKNVNSTNNQDNNLKSNRSSFFNELDIKSRLEQEKKREMQNMIRNLKSIRGLREKVEGKQKKESQKRKGKKSPAEKKTDFKNFLRAFGNPVK